MEACNKENNHHRGVDQSYIRVLEMTKGSMDMEHGSTSTTTRPAGRQILFTGAVSAV